MNLTILVLSITAITGHFNKGLKSYEAKDYKTAIVEFSKVIESKTDKYKILETSYYFRALAHYEFKQKDLALEDARWLIYHSKSNDMQSKMTKNFIDWGGDPETLKPKVGPNDTWRSFIDHCINKDLAKAREISSGRFNQEVLRKSSPENLAMMANKLLEIKIWGEVEGKDTSYIYFDKRPGGDDLIRLIFKRDKVKNIWIIDDFNEIEDGINDIKEVIKEDKKKLNWKPVVLSDKKIELINKLIKELSNEDALKRKVARDRLIDMGEDIHHFLENKLKTEDVEIRANIREIIRSK